MQENNGIDLSPKKVEYLKYIFEHDGSVKTGDLAAHFSVDDSTISKTITDLVKSGFLTHAPYQRIGLSARGMTYAEFFIKRHRILSLMLTHYGFSHEHACDEVSRFESYVSKSAVDRICRMMGHPQTGTCGAITHDSGCLGEGTARKQERKSDRMNVAGR